MTNTTQQLTIQTDQPFFEQALRHGVTSGIITHERVKEIIAETPEGIVQIAGVFGNKYLRPSIEEARVRIVHLVSLYLQATCHNDLDRAALSLQNQSIIAHSRGGSNMLKEFNASRIDNSFHSSKNSSDLGNLYKQFSLDGAGYPKYLALQEENKKNKAILDASLWCIRQNHVNEGDFKTVYQEYQENFVTTEHVLCTFLLSYFHPSKKPTDQISTSDLRDIMTHIRQKQLWQDQQREPIFATILSKVPPEQRHVFEKILNENIVATLTDMGKKKVSVNEIIPYFNISDTSVLAMSHGESEIMSAWHEITEGKNRVDSFSACTLLISALTGKTLKTSISRKELQDIIKTIKSQDADTCSKHFHNFLTTHVPFEDQEIFKDLWGEIESNIHDITTGEMDEVEAIELFSYHCSLKKPTKAQQKNSNYR